MRRIHGAVASRKELCAFHTFRGNRYRNAAIFFIIVLSCDPSGSLASNSPRSANSSTHGRWVLIELMKVVTREKSACETVAGPNPAPVEMVSIQVSHLV